GGSRRPDPLELGDGPGLGQRQATPERMSVGCAVRRWVARLRAPPAYARSAGAMTAAATSKSPPMNSSHISFTCSSFTWNPGLIFHAFTEASSSQSETEV